MLDALPNLEIISVFGVGYDGVPVDYCKKRGLKVNKPNAEQMQEWNTLADNLYPRVRGKMVPADTFDEVVGHLKAFRAGQR